MKIDATASSQVIIAGDLPKVELFEVDHITAVRHTKVGAADMMKVTYYCGSKAFSDYVCVEHTGYALHKAHEWWAMRTKDACPVTVADALDQIADLPPPSHLRVWINKKNPQIMAHCFDGTNFGTESATPIRASVDVKKPMAETLMESQAKRAATAMTGFDDMDDDIPF